MAALDTVFSYVYIPADASEPMEERTASNEGGLENDDLLAKLRSLQGMGPNIDIVAMTVPSPKPGPFQHLAVSLYKSGNTGADSLQPNERVMGLMNACGMASPEPHRGPCVISRYFDDDDAWKRVDFKLADCSSDAAWVVAAKASNAGRGSKGSSLSSILNMQNAVNIDGSPAAAAAAAGVASAASGSATAEGTNIEEGLEGTSFTWTQSKEEVEIVVPLPSGATKSSVKAVFHSSSLRLAFEGGAGPVLDGQLNGKVDVDGCSWTIEAGSSVVITLEKAGEAPWMSLFV